MAPAGPPSFVLRNRLFCYPVAVIFDFSVSGYRLFLVNNRPACTPIEVVMEVPSPCLAINEIPFTIRNELREVKNKVVRT
jgi:hypothetical protein